MQKLQNQINRFRKCQTKLPDLGDAKTTNSEDVKLKNPQIQMMPQQIIRLEDAKPNLPSFRRCLIISSDSVAMKTQNSENAKSNNQIQKTPLPDRVRHSYSISLEGGKCERLAFRFEPKQNLSKYIKLNLFVFVQDGGKCERFAFRFVPKKKCKRNCRTLLLDSEDAKPNRQIKEIFRLSNLSSLKKGRQL